MKIAAAMVLAAGRGDRMQPLSLVLPKPALPLDDEPVIASALRLAAATGTRRVVVNTWHLADAMERAIAEVVLDAEIAISREEELMDTAGGLALARDRGLLGDRGPVLIINGDGLLDLDLSPLLDRAQHTDDLVSLALLPHLDPQRWSRVILDPEGAVDCIIKPGDPEPGEAPFLYPGVMLVSRKALDSLPSHPGAIHRYLWGPALTAQRLGGAVVSGHWREIGTPPDLLEAVLARLGGDVAIHPTANVHPSAQIGSACIGRRARVEARAIVENSIVAEGATVGREARVSHSILLGEISADAQEHVVGEFRAPLR